MRRAAPRLMRLALHSTTTRWSHQQRANTLLEVMVASTIFAGLTTILVLLLQQHQRASAKIIANSDVTAESMVLFEKTRAEITRAKVLGVTPDLQSVSYWVPRSQAGAPVILASGNQDWLPGDPSPPDIATLSYSRGKGLTRTFQGRTQTLANCSKDTVLNFGYSAGRRLFQLYGYVGTQNSQSAEKNSYQPFFYQLQLTNVQ